MHTTPTLVRRSLGATAAALAVMSIGLTNTNGWTQAVPTSGPLSTATEPLSSAPQQTPRPSDPIAGPITTDAPVPAAGPQRETSTAAPANTYTVPVVNPQPAPDDFCAGGYTIDELNSAIQGTTFGPGDIVGADYGRVQQLPDGRMLWVFQDVFIGGTGANLDSAAFVHNAAVVQSGLCFDLVGGSSGRANSWIGGDVEQELWHWFWPLDSVMTTDGTLAQFVVEMRNPNGSGAFEGAEPIAVWIATIDPTDLSVLDFRPAPDPGDRPLYGFSITSDDAYTYLYGHCYRQFADPGYVGLHDTECGPDMYVARVPVGRIDVAPQYWDGTAWSPNRADAAPISTRFVLANPMQVRRLGDMFLAVTKRDDWWGSILDIDVAPTAHGPWTTVMSIEPTTRCERCVTYAPHLLPWTDPDGSLLILISNNAWDMKSDAFANPDLYQSQVIALDVPPIVIRSAHPPVKSR
jgi:hypothetical protein